jgi:hypothetical protein
MNYLMIFERRILKKIFGPIHERDGWKFMNNNELNKLIGEDKKGEIHRS